MGDTSDQEDANTPIDSSAISALKDAAADKPWARWVMQTSRTWGDISDIIRKTGIESIDYDHQKMTEVVLDISGLIDMYDSGDLRLSTIAEQGKILEDLHGYAVRHFTREIEVIEKYGLPGLEIQLKQHGEFLKMLDGYIEDFREGRLTVSQNLKQSVLEWWVRHINEVDYSTFCLDNWTQAAIKNARSWDDVSQIIKQTGVDSLDAEHREMSEIALELIQFIGGKGKEASQSDRDNIVNIFNRLIECAEKHFSHEETFIQNFNLPDLEKQEDQHRKFISILVGYRDGIQSGATTATEQLKFDVLQWWISHINDVDYNSFSLDKWAHVLLANSKNWEEAREFIRRTNVDEIDDDHRQITEMIIQCDGLIQRQNADPDDPLIREEGALLYDGLKENCLRHFQREEEIMRKKQYFAYRQHKEQHEKFLNMLNKQKNDLIEGRSILSRNIKMILLEWWVNHIREFDMRAFGKFEPKPSIKEIAEAEFKEDH